MTRVYSPVEIEQQLDASQLQRLAECIQEVAGHGYGRVTIVIDRGRPAFIETLTSERLGAAQVQ